MSEDPLVTDEIRRRYDQLVDAWRDRILSNSIPPPPPPEPQRYQLMYDAVRIGQRLSDVGDWPTILRAVRTARRDPSRPQPTHVRHYPPTSSTTR